MRKFKHWEQSPDDDSIPVEVITTEEDIRQKFYPEWCELMCKKYGKDWVDKEYSFEDCIEDWMIVNWGKEI